MLRKCTLISVGKCSAYIQCCVKGEREKKIMQLLRAKLICTVDKSGINKERERERANYRLYISNINGPHSQEYNYYNIYIYRLLGI